MDHYAIFKRVWYKELHFFGSAVGCGFFAPNYKMNILTFLSLGSTSLSVVIAVNTMYTFDFEIAVQSMAMNLLGFEVSLRLRHPN